MREALRFKIKDIAYIGVFAALQCIISGFAIPIGPISITLATLGIYLFSALFPIRISVSVVIVYILLGIIGLPVFSNFNSGIAVLTGVTGGYIIGFLLSALLYWAMTRALGEKTPVMVAAMALGLIVCYAFGTAWFMVVYARNAGAIGLGTALGWCVFPFIIPDLVKIALAVGLTRVLKPHVH